MRIEANYLNIIKTMYDKTTANILSGEKLKAFPLSSETRQGCPLHHYYSTQFWMSQLHQFRKEKEIKGIQIRKEVKLSLFADDMILYLENPKDTIRKLLELKFRAKQLQDTKSIHRYHLHFQILIMKNQKEKLRNQSHSPLQRKIKYLGMT